MRIISGRLKGRKLVAPKGQGLRPTADPVKETLFNMIGPALAQAMVLDLFAGTGNVGIEALSRGAAQVVFVEKERTHLEFLKRNLAACGVEAQSVVMSGDANTMLRVLSKAGRQFDLIFLDPPYRQTNLLNDVLAYLAGTALLAEAGIVVVEQRVQDAPAAVINNAVCSDARALVLEKTRRSGDTALSFYVQRSV